MATESDYLSLNSPSTTYALVSHDSAVEAIWALAARGWEGTLDDENIWLVPAPEYCVRTQGEVKQLSREIDLASLGIIQRPIDLLVPNKSCFSRGKQARFHVWADSFPPHSFVRLHERLLVSTPYFAMLQLSMPHRASRVSQATARQLSQQDAQYRSQLGLGETALTVEDLLRWDNIARTVHATQIMCDFMGTYRYVPSQDPMHPYSNVVFDTRPIIKPESLERYLAEMNGAKGITRARQVVSLSFSGCASPMETMLALMLTLPTDFGGYGLPRPKTNWLFTPKPEHRSLSPQSFMSIDLCWPEQKVALEYYGWEEHFGAGSHKVASDAARSNALASMGWTVLHATFEQICRLDSMTLLANQVAEALRVPLHTPSELETIWRMRLLTQLLPKITRI